MSEKDTGFKLKESSMGWDLAAIDDHSFYLMFHYTLKDKSIRKLWWRLNDFDYPLYELHVSEKV